MTRDELEALIWRNGVRTADAVDAILTAADEYVLAYISPPTADITAQRRQELADALRKPRRKAVVA